MLKRCLLALLLSVQPVTADELPAAIACYESSTNEMNIDAYMACFIPDATMIDVSREFQGHDAIRAWALREVIANGETFKHRKILETSEGFAKTEVNWLSWVVHYSYWWNPEGKITRMSLQYAD
jgi:ketosteroid isomerase-like protein